MSYEKQTWAKGDVVTSAKLNHMEDGISDAGGIMWVHLTSTDGMSFTSDTSNTVITDAIEDGVPVFATMVFTMGGNFAAGGVSGVSFATGSLNAVYNNDMVLYNNNSTGEYGWALKTN